MELPRRGLVTYTWGNVSGIDREKGLVVIKPSGVEYEELTPGRIWWCWISNGNRVEGDLNPSSDTQAPILSFTRLSRTLGGIVHTHSPHAVAWAQAGRDIPGLRHHARRLLLRPGSLRPRADPGGDRRGL